MRSIYLNLLLCFACLASVRGQAYFRSSYSVVLDTLSLSTYKIQDTDPDYDVLKIETGYGEFMIKNEADLARLKNASIVSVDLVYTRYPQDENFDELNKKRLGFLHLVCPDVFGNPVTKWRLVAQTNCNSKTRAASMFHGFIITYREAPVFAGGGSDKDYIKDIVEGKTAMPDSTIFKIFKRNNFNEAAVVADFTGSMSPYIAQVLLWYYLNFNVGKFSDFTFFNDGDSKLDHEKMLGKVGGIYYCKSGNKDTVLNVAFRCISGGYGGDAQENDVEAILYTLQKNKDIREIILIADNLAPIRDVNIASKITVPVHIIICGYRPGLLNSQFLDLAYATKGSIHTIEEDLENLKDIQEGKTLLFGGVEYRLVKGKFVKISKT
jgi:hypothetical protein